MQSHAAYLRPLYGWCVLQYVGVCCSVLQCVATKRYRVQPIGSLFIVGVGGVVCRSLSQCVPVCCSVLQRVAACHSVLQRHCCVSYSKNAILCCPMAVSLLCVCVAVCYSVLQCVAAKMRSYVAQWQSLYWLCVLAKMRSYVAQWRSLHCVCVLQYVAVCCSKNAFV